MFAGSPSGRPGFLRFFTKKTPERAAKIPIPRATGMNIGEDRISGSFLSFSADLSTRSRLSFPGSAGSSETSSGCVVLVSSTGFNNIVVVARPLSVVMTVITVLGASGRMDDETTVDTTNVLTGIVVALSWSDPPPSLPRVVGVI